MGLRSATAINVATMVGAGPFITLPLVVAALHGSVSIAGWIVGALIALCDGLVWAELASRYPRSGATYAYLRDALGPRFGPGAAFLFVWQYLFWAPLILASGYIGFSQYAAFLIPALASPFASHAVAVGIGVVTLAALWRAIPGIARMGLTLGVIAIVTLIVVAFAGVTHPHAPLAVSLHAAFFSSITLPMLGAALVITLYDYSGYADICALGDEVMAPARTIPRSIIIAVTVVAAAYIFLNIGVVAALAPADIQASTTVASTVVQRAFGTPAAIGVTIAVLLTAFGSTYGLLLAAARVPFAAARDGAFFPIFTRLHPRAGFPVAGLLTIGLLALPASLFPLDAVISALTAGIVLVQGVGQIVALAVARHREPTAKFLMPMYPLPALAALAGWVFLFCSTGPSAIGFGLGTLVIGLGVYFAVVRPRQRVALLGVALVCAALAVPMHVSADEPTAATPTWNHAIIAQRDGEPTLLVDGKPFFFWGGAFFYERIPADRWRASMLAMKELGANTLDLYVPWNWHELSDGDFDFDGHTNPRRNLREVLRLGKELGFRFIVRPGPVIRNEWRNGGYPQWLLTRPEYDMPLGDVLDGRYPATATLQNGHSDDAAAEWMRNATHMRYASRWLHTVLAEFAPVADRVIAVQLDDDQGAYIDNQTYPAPHFLAYLGWLESQVRDVVGPAIPTYINTYQMRVPASSPEWTMGNWYQSDAYTIGEHDRSEIDFSTLLLGTNRRGPLAQSEFQAGWLASAADVQPRSADPSNTEIALSELIGLGTRGILDFPMQDTLAPFGWEAPWSNAFYGWDAALDVNARGEDSAARETRYTATKSVGDEIAALGSLLAESHRRSSVAIAVRLSAADALLAPGIFSAAMHDALARCSRLNLACTLFDPAAIPGDTRTFRQIVVPSAIRTAAAPTSARILQAWRRSGIDVRDAPNAAPSTSPFSFDQLDSADGTLIVVRNWSGKTASAVIPSAAPSASDVFPLQLAPGEARILLANVRLAALDAAFGPNDRVWSTCRIGSEGGAIRFDTAPQWPGRDCTTTLRIRGRLIVLRPQYDQIIALHDIATAAMSGVAPQLEPLPRPTGTPPITLGNATETLSAQSILALRGIRPSVQSATAYRADVFADGSSEIVLQTPTALAVIVPDGGGRVVHFVGRYSAFDATGGGRDALDPEPGIDARDYIGRYTHGYPAGTAQRPYAVTRMTSGRSALAELTYTMPDAGMRFTKRYTLSEGADRLVEDVRADGTASTAALISAITVPSKAAVISEPLCETAGTAFVRRLGPATPPSGASTVNVMSWAPGTTRSCELIPAQTSTTVRITYPTGRWLRVTYTPAFMGDADLPEFIEAERQWVAANPPDEHP